jgi:hypothetical protein
VLFFDQQSQGCNPMPNYTALATLLALVFYFYTTFAVASARAKFGVTAPAIAGNPDFERVFRVQMNTLEWMPIFLPSHCSSHFTSTTPRQQQLALSGF